MSGMKYSDEDYIYGSTRIQAIETRSVGTERILRACDAKSYSEAERIFEEAGLKLNSGVEEALSVLLNDAFRLLNEVTPEPELFDVLRLPYDCHNIKAAIKCSILHTPSDGILYTIGTVEPSAILSMTRERSFEQLPENMRRAAYAAYEAYYHSNDPQQIDFLLDSACYLDMKASAEQSSLPLAREIVEYKADSTNILTAVRMIRMNAPFLLFERVMLPGGILESTLFADAYEAESVRAREQKLFGLLESTRYSLKVNAGDSLTDIEKDCENLYLGFIKEKASDCSYGAAVIASFIVKRETEVKNIRIVLSGRAAGLPSQIIRARLRLA